MFCTQCGNRNNDEACFCVQCGKELSVGKTANVIELKQQDVKNTLTEEPSLRPIEKSNVGKVKPNKNISIYSAFFIVLIFAIALSVYLYKSKIITNKTADNNESLITPKTPKTSQIERSDSQLRLNGPAFSGIIADGQPITLSLRVAGAPSCAPTSSGKVECNVILYSGGRPNPGVSIDLFRREFALAIDEVDVTMELQSSNGRVISRSEKSSAGATPGYQQVIIASKLPPGEYRVVASSTGNSGRFSMLWSEPIGD